jgi:hypothetical protein
LQRSRWLRINFREIFGAVRFSTFSTVSAQSGRSYKPHDLLNIDIHGTLVWHGMTALLAGSMFFQHRAVAFAADEIWS